MAATDQELDVIFQTAMAVGEDTLATMRAGKVQPSTGETVGLDEQVESAVALIDSAAAELPMEKSLQLFDLREALAGTSDEAIEPLHVIRGVLLGLLWSTSLWLVIIAVGLWILVVMGVRF